MAVRLSSFTRAMFSMCPVLPPLLWQYGTADQVEVSHEIEHLVTGEFVVETEAPC